MKKKTMLTFTVLLSLICNIAFSSDAGKKTLPGGEDKITTLIINANVTVVLVNNVNANTEMTGRNSLMENITLNVSGDTLVIGSLKKRDFINAGVVYVPASMLKNIRINSAASVRTLSALRIPRLDVVINGACHISISSLGKLNFFETEKYSFEQTRFERELPASLFQE